MTRKEILNLKIEAVNKLIFQQIKENWDNAAKPLDSLGVFETMVAKIGAIQETVHPVIEKRAVVVMCADNGIVEEGISQSDQSVTRAVAKALGRGVSSVNRMAMQAKADVIPVDIGINHTERIHGVLDRKVALGTRNFRKEEAMTKEEVAQAISVGISLVKELKEKGYQILATGEMGIGNTTTSSAVAVALTGCAVEAMTGKGAGLSEEGLIRKQNCIKEAFRKYCLQEKEPFEILQSVGGLDIAGLTGVFIGGALYHLPVVIDGVISGVAALVAERLCPGVKDYMLASHISKECAAKEVLSLLGLKAVIDAELALGEGTGAVMLFPMLDMAFSLYDNASSFAEIEVEPYKRWEV